MVYMMDEPTTVGFKEVDVYKRLQTRLGEVWGRRDITQPISFRIPLYIKMIYDSLDAESKRRIRLGLEQLILAIAGLDPHPNPTQPIIINMNMNINENRNEVRLEISQELMKKLDDLLGLLEFIAFQSTYPENIKRRAELGYRALRQLKKLLVDMN